MMTFRELKNHLKAELLSGYDEQEIDSLFYLILEHVHNLKRIDLALNPNLILTQSEISRWNNIVAQLKIHKPIQYILGKTEFFGLQFNVNENTLIPRPETEELVQWIIDNNAEKSDSTLKILDIGTGSGCIAISLAKNLRSSLVTAIDVSESALETAKENAEINSVRVNFIQKNILQTDDLDEQFDIIVSNPPYVRNMEKVEIKPNVLDYEPHTALFVDDENALVFYRKIAHLALKNLNSDGQLYFEINQYLGKETVELLDGLGFKKTELRKDIYGNERMIFALR